ncbi:PREDICTED: TBC1 domain family member 31 isoform X1 [Rhagoletis zephyria]|uniref:TBC1 domain family member 31 isoform X1 n=1 Tax=Rhagoletis zephyria TaxID=28612 RepID=UPI0008118562|nr:PREDICTED: TBC1 domain family member 31 isoform X1 [Rhagoletis zephyria]
MADVPEPTNNNEASSEAASDDASGDKEVAATATEKDKAAKASASAGAAGAAIEDDSEEEAEPTSSLQLGGGQPVRKYAFSFKETRNGNILTIHHTIQEGNRITRIRMAACCFSEHCTFMVAIDRRGNIFAFDFINKRFWQLIEVILRVTVITPWIQRSNLYLVGTKLGQLLLLDIEKSAVIKTIAISNETIKAISFVGQPLQPQRFVLVQAGCQALLVNLSKFILTHRLTFDDENIILKFACYLPCTEQIFTCFTNNTVYIWSSVTLNRLRVIHPINMRDRKLNIEGAAALSADIVLYDDFTNVGGDFNVNCQELNYADGLIIAFCCHPFNNLLCLSTLDRYLLLINTITFEIQHICRLNDIVISECVFLPHSKEILICGVTTDPGQVVILNCINKDNKIRIQADKGQKLTISHDGKLLTVLNRSGELNIWSICKLYNSLKSQQECLQILKSAFNQNKPVAIGASGNPNAALEDDDCILNNNVRKLLTRDRLLPILDEYRWFPRKYRVMMWCALLQLPNNRREFNHLLKLGIPPIVKQRAQHIQIRNETMKRALVRVWSCLARWCPVFAHSKFVPELIFPFVKLIPRNPLVVFEICATLITNQFQLCFELHPLEPKNYLGLCENILQLNAPQLCKFYASMQVGPEDYIWPMITTAFSDVLSTSQWLCAWDNIMVRPPYFPIFLAVAYNIVQREVIVRLPDKPTILSFFRDSYPVDVEIVLKKAYYLMQKCPQTLHPKRYMKEFQSIPKNVYPKFLNYPREWLVKHEEDLAAVQREQRSIDARIRELELEEMKLMERLQSGLRNEEHAKQVERMEKLYRDSLKREEERLAYQRKVLMLYQKEIRNRKAEVAAQVQESEQRQRTLQMEKDLELLMQSIECERTRNDADLLMAEDEVRNQDVELYVQKCLSAPRSCSLRTKYHGDIQKLCNERRLLKAQLNEISNLHKPAASTRSSSQNSQLDTIEERIEEIQREFNDILKSN